MSYRVVTGPGLPFVHALPSGLGQDPSTPVVPPIQDAPWWGTLIARVADPLAKGVSSRIAYGQTPTAARYPSEFAVSTPTGTYRGGAFGGFDPTMLLLLGGGALLLLMGRH